MPSISKSAGPDPARYALSGSEEAQQIALFMKAAQNLNTYPELKFMFAIPNGGFRNKSEAGKLKASGVKSGVPDICLPVKRGPYSGLWIELKRPASSGKKQGKPSPEQEEWIAFLRSQGFGAMVCVGYEMAWNVIMDYLAWPNKKTEPELVSMGLPE